MKVAVVSSCFGGYDEPHEPTPQALPEHVTEVEFVMVTDGEDWPGWRTVVEPRLYLHSNVAAKVAKMRPDLYTDAEYTIWVDAGATFDEGLVASVVPESKHHWRMYRHPDRVKLADEVAVSRTLRKYHHLRMEDQIQHYLDAGYTDDQLWATGVIGRPNTLYAHQVGDAWLREILRWGFQDQLSLPYVLSQYGDMGAMLQPIEGNLWYSPFIQFTNHAAKP